MPPRKALSRRRNPVSRSRETIIVKREDGLGKSLGGVFGGLVESAAYGAGAAVVSDMLPDSWDVWDMGAEVTSAVVTGVAGALTGSAQLKRVSRAAAAVAGADLVRSGAWKRRDGGYDPGSDSPIDPEDL